MLDYVVTTHLYFKYSRLILRLITYLRSTFVNDECYAQSAIKAIMHEHILHALPDLQRQIFCTVEDFEKLDLVSTFEWESETTFQMCLEMLLSPLLDVALFKPGCACKFLRFIRNEPFNLKMGLIPRDNSQEIRSKRVVDVVESLIGAYFNSSGEVATLSFMK
ncbi:hypothetical protein H5410_000897 [Solanum commersonii]|uniref:RNase III domain-containing protein n=1 Tax=Solanum commersonii TaxID=4109 RepID=A0A9J6AXJ4_SOLCO|nr:hypothetical protein H5410_000897 [Solanum commersonii]